jgi:hypothetical protein
MLACYSSCVVIFAVNWTVKCIVVWCYIKFIGQYIRCICIVGIATGYGLDDPGSIRDSARFFS